MIYPMMVNVDRSAKTICCRGVAGDYDFAFWLSGGNATLFVDLST